MASFQEFVGQTSKKTPAESHVEFLDACREMGFVKGFIICHDQFFSIYSGVDIFKKELGLRLIHHFRNKLLLLVMRLGYHIFIDL